MSLYVRRRVAQWALKHAGVPQLGEWRTAGGRHWRLSTMTLNDSMLGGSRLVLEYVAPMDMYLASSHPVTPEGTTQEELQ